MDGWQEATTTAVTFLTKKWRTSLFRTAACSLIHRQLARFQVLHNQLDGSACHTAGPATCVPRSLYLFLHCGCIDRIGNELCKPSTVYSACSCLLSLSLLRPTANAIRINIDTASEHHIYPSSSSFCWATLCIQTPDPGYSERGKRKNSGRPAE